MTHLRVSFLSQKFRKVARLMPLKGSLTKMRELLGGKENNILPEEAKSKPKKMGWLPDLVGELRC